MRQYEIAPEKHIVYTYNYSIIGYSYYRWEAPILSWHFRGFYVQEISRREYNNRKVYDRLNHLFTADFCGPYLIPPPITFHDRLLPYKISRYSPDLLLGAISVASEIYVSDLTTPSDLPRLLLLISDYPNPPHEMKKYEPYRVRVKKGYCSS